MVEEPQTIGDVAEIINSVNNGLGPAKVSNNPKHDFTKSYSSILVDGQLYSDVFVELLEHNIVVASIQNEATSTRVWFDRITTEERVVEVTETVNTFENVD